MVLGWGTSGGLVFGLQDFWSDSFFFFWFVYYNTIQLHYNTIIIIYYIISIIFFLTQYKKKTKNKIFKKKNEKFPPVLCFAPGTKWCTFMPHDFWVPKIPTLLPMAGIWGTFQGWGSFFSPSALNLGVGGLVFAFFFFHSWPGPSKQDPTHFGVKLFFLCGHISGGHTPPGARLRS